jgi:hypothetical protein
MDQQLNDILEECKRNPNLTLQEIALLQKLLTQAIEICKNVASFTPPLDPLFEPMQVDE